jgi:REP element-mobilizing transposase RayT
MIMNTLQRVNENIMPIRKPNRLKDYDYSQNSAYFITICVKNMREMLGKIVGDGVLDVPKDSTDVGGAVPSAPRIELTETGEMVKHHIENMNSVYEHVHLGKYIIMPNHIHLIISIVNDTSKAHGSSRTPTPTNATIPRFISTLKRYTNKYCGFSIWQRSYHDHIIRNEAEYQKIWEYIDTNPLNWQEDKYYGHG